MNYDREFKLSKNELLELSMAEALELDREEILAYTLTSQWHSHRQYYGCSGYLERYPQGHIDPNARVHSTVKMGPGCVIMPGAVIEADVELGSRVVVARGLYPRYQPRVRRGSRVGDGTFIEGAVVGQYAKIGYETILRDVKVGWNAGIGNRCIILPSTIGDMTKISDHVYIDILSAIGARVTIGAKNYIGQSVNVKNQATIGSMCVILEDSIIKAKALVDDSFIKKSAVVGSRSIIRNSLVRGYEVISARQHIINSENITPPTNFFSWWGWA